MLGNKVAQVDKQIKYPTCQVLTIYLYSFYIGARTKHEGSSQQESSDNPIQVLDEFRGEKSDAERNTTEVSVMQSMSVLL